MQRMRYLVLGLVLAQAILWVGETAGEFIGGRVKLVGTETQVVVDGVVQNRIRIFMSGRCVLSNTPYNNYVILLSGPLEGEGQTANAEAYRIVYSTVLAAFLAEHDCNVNFFESIDPACCTTGLCTVSIPQILVELVRP